jgi:ribose 5-phosphate isomerase B
MRIALGADHAGVVLKDQIKTHLANRGIACTDFGTSSEDSVDYPDFAVEVGRAVGSGTCDRGVLVCGSGIGMAVAANKIAGVRAAPIGDETTARLSRQHNNLNVLTLGARLLDADAAKRIVDTFLETAFDGGRHQQRLNKIAALDSHV